MTLATTNCKTDALNTMGHVQSYGALIAFHVHTQEAHYCSVNTRQVLGDAPSEILGKTGEQIFSDAWPEIANLPVKHVAHGVRARQFPEPLDAAAHLQGQYYIYEFEPSPRPAEHWWDFGRRTQFISELGAATNPAQLRKLLVRWLFKYTGYDRVMYYHFYPDMHGVVRQEECKPGVQGFLGLHFPASDIPPNAHAFYVRNFQRIIADAQSAEVPLVPHTPAAPPLDLTSSMLRSVHPVHIEYLRNMGVTASFSVSIVVKGVLRALVACHNMKAAAIPLADRLAFEEMARMASLYLENLTELHSRDSRAHLRQQLSHIEGALSSTDGGTSGGLASQLPNIASFLNAPAGIFTNENGRETTGPIVDPAAIAGLERWIDSLPGDQLTMVTSLPPKLGENQELAAAACGILHIPIRPGVRITLLRPELVYTTAWAGQPQGTSDLSSTTPLSPRNSFKQWIIESRGTAQPWTPLELEFAGELRQVLIGYAEKFGLTAKG